MSGIIGIIATPYTDQAMGLKRQMVTSDYIAAIEKAGGIPIIIPLHENKDQANIYLEICDGILVCGGIDLNPLTYGEQPHPLLGKNNLDFDKFELRFIRQCIEYEKPILAVCRGIQLFNVACGGSLYQDVSLHEGNIIGHMQKETSRCGVCHKVRFRENTRLYELFGKEVYTNSFHHQAIKEIGEGLTVSAVAEDGIIEAIEREGHPFQIGVQWHPECMFSHSEAMRPLFESFIATAKN